MNEECPAMAPTGALHRWGHNPLLNATFCQDCGACNCPEHDMLVLDTGLPIGRVEDTPSRRDFLRRLIGR